MMRKFEREGLFIGGDDARETDRQILHHNEAIRGLPVLSRQHRYSSAIQHNILVQDREGTYSHMLQKNYYYEMYRIYFNTCVLYISIHLVSTTCTFILNLILVQHHNNTEAE